VTVRRSVVLADDWFPVPLPANFEMGEDSYLYSAYAFSHFRSTRPVAVRLGHHTGVYQHTQFILGPDGEVHIGDYATINATVFATNGRVVVGDYAMFGYGVIVADDPFAVPVHTVPDATGSLDPPSITIGANTWIGARCVLLLGADIGDDSVIGAGTVVDFPVPTGVIVAGNPARVIGSVRG
jgi:acetyltransferase-like isoleucine patch superfamily enzyme